MGKPPGERCYQYSSRRHTTPRSKAVEVFGTKGDTMLPKRIITSQLGQGYQHRIEWHFVWKGNGETSPRGALKT